MPIGDYIKLTIGDMEVQVEKPEDLPVSINYSLEDAENFQNKTSANSLSLSVPATLVNDKAANTFRNAGIRDMTTGQVFRGNQKCIIESNGQELLVGKAFLLNGKHTDRPTKYEFNLYGDNANWIIDLQEKTMYDFLMPLNISFTKAQIIASWAFNGTDENLPYVFAPVRYRFPFGGYTANAQTNVLDPVDDNVKPEYLKPSLSKYWILYWAFKSLGYKISSTFFDSEYFRRQVMPWTWGNFLESEGTKLDIHRFLAKSLNDSFFNSPNGRHEFYWALGAIVNPSTIPGTFDNNGDYTYDAASAEMRWQYKTNQNFGKLTAAFSIDINVDADVSGNSDITLAVRWYKNSTAGAWLQEDTLVNIQAGPGLVRHTRDQGIKSAFFNVDVDPGDIIIAKVWVSAFEGKIGICNLHAQVFQFTIDYFKVPLGGTVGFSNLLGFKNYKILDFIRGIIDEENLSVNTDPINKIVYMEPTHPYSKVDDLTIKNDGYFKNDFVDWNGKEDLSKEWEMDNYSDYEKELLFKYKEDGNDGALKLVQDRNVNILAQGKYVFPDRFKTGKKQIENRFFSPLMHYDAEQWKSVTGEAPQVPCLIPENVSNTSASAADNTFAPKSAYYKGNVSGVGGWKFDGDVHTTFPFMFSVNYKEGGENDPILSYSDEKITHSTGFIVGKGLLKRFYWQRLAIMRNGQWYNCWFRLKNIDVANQLHREYKSYLGQRWELVNIKDYKPLTEGSTACLLRRWAPIEQTDDDNTYPSANYILNGITPGVTNPLDIKYGQLKCLVTDIPV